MNHVPGSMVSVESAVDPLSRSVVFLTLRFKNPEANFDEVLATGTGVIRNFGGQHYLITALHNLTGRESDGKCKDKRGYQPNYIRIEGFHTDLTFALYSGLNDPLSDAPLFWRHPSAPEVDLAILPLSAGAEINTCLDESFFDESQNAVAIKIYATQVCHIVGFPEGLVDRTHANFPLPVYKTGHLASEPATDFQGQPIVLVDAVTRPGQSGSPVFVRASEFSIRIAAYRFVGIYVGRLTSRRECGTEYDHWSVGRVFKPRVIAEIFSNHGL